MTLALANTAGVIRTSSLSPSSPGSFKSDWLVGITPGGMDTADATPIQNPLAIEDSHKLRIPVPDGATGFQMRMAYDDGDTPNVSPVLQAFGIDGKGAEAKLFTMGGDHQITLAPDVNNDSTDGSMLHTDPSDLIDCCGASEVVIGVHTAYTVSAGDATLAQLEVRFLNG